MDLNGKRVAILVDNLYQEMEVWVPYYFFQAAGAEVVTVGNKAGETYKSKLGYPCVAARSYADLSESDFDGVLAPGGFAPDYIRRHPKALEFVKAMDSAGKLVCAICHGPWVLCSADVLRNRRATCFHSIKTDVLNAGARFEDAEVVVDRNLVTSRTPDDLPAFCREATRVMAEQPAPALL